MIILHDFKIGIEEYEVKGKGNNFTVFERCPGCNCIAQGNVHRNGYYFRYGVNDDRAYRIPICRYICMACKVNISILPSFLIPYYQHTLQSMVEQLSRSLNGEIVDGSWQLLAQHVKRFNEDIHWIHSFFTDLGHPLSFTKDRKKEALKYVKMILDFGESPFFRRSWGHLSSYFMSKLILPYLGCEKNKYIPT